MTCAKAHRLVSAWLDQELSAEEMIDLENHLDACPSCSILASDLARIHRAARMPATAPIGDDFLIGVETRIAASRLRSRRCRWSAATLPRMGLVAAGVCAVAVLALTSNPRQRVSEFTEAEAETNLRMASMQSVGLAAGDPLEDVAIASLTAHVAAAAESEDVR